MQQEYGQCQSLCPLSQKGNTVNSSTSECGKVYCQVLLKWLLEELKMFLSPGCICLYYSILPRAVSGPWNYLFLVCREKR